MLFRRRGAIVSIEIEIDVVGLVLMMELLIVLLIFGATFVFTNAATFVIHWLHRRQVDALALAR